VTIRVRRVQEIASGEVFSPLWRDVRLDGQRLYQPDIIALAEQFTERMTYRNTREELGKLVPGVPSPRTINRRVIEDGTRLNQALHQRELVTGSVMPDGTQLHAQKGGQHDVNITLAIRPGNRPRLRCLTVGKGWEEHQRSLTRTRFRTPEGRPAPPTVASDLERGLAESMTPEGGFWQPDHVHVIRYTGYALWLDGLKRGPEKSAIVGEVSRSLAHLRNSLALHLPRGEIEAVRYRIQQIVVPWHTNLLERLMGEVSKRCKHKWMSWTPHGSRALLTLLTTRALEPRTHEQFWRQKLYGRLIRLPQLGIRVTLLGGRS
jgi:hypothetical protein